MKTITKLINVNDGHEKELQNGKFLHIVHYPRAETIISEFLNDGWKLLQQTQRITPAMQKPGCFSFYLGGWDLLFSKE